MQNTGCSLLSRRAVLAGAGIAALASTLARANTPGSLIVKNASKSTLTFQVVEEDWFNCCDTPKPGQAWGPVAPGASIRVTYLRTDGHGCNGRQGQFSVIPTFEHIQAVPQRFWFDNDAGLEFPRDAPRVNYHSRLVQVGYGYYRWEVAPPD